MIALQIGDSPFPTTASAIKAAHAAIDAGLTRYCPSLGLPEFRETIAKTVHAEFGIPATAENVVVGPGAKVFETYFCEAFLEPGDAVLVFQPAFPTFEPNILRRGAKPVYVPLKQENQFRPDLGAIEQFVKTEPRAAGSSSTSPHNPTGGVATPDDLKAHRRHRPRDERRGVQRRAVLPHGLGRQAPQHPGRTGNDGAVRGRVHVLEELQHERVAVRVHDRVAAAWRRSWAR